MSSEFEQQAACRRAMIPHARSEDLLKLFKLTHGLLAQWAITSGGLTHEPETVKQQYRLTVYAVEQELLKRLHVKA